MLLQKVETICDMASIKIHNEGLSCFFGNNFGDGDNLVEIHDKHELDDCKFLGHFTVKKGVAHLAYSDCDDSSVYQFSKGRWFVGLKENSKFSGHFIIYKCDEDVHA